MRRMRLLILNELKMVRTALPIHLIAVLQPALMYLIMASVLVHPTFDINVAKPTSEAGQRLLEAMYEVGSADGIPYINPVCVNEDDPVGAGVVTVEEVDNQPTAVYRYGLIDSNIVKNLRNRLTAAALRVWDDSLDGHAVRIVEKPWLPQDPPYNLYFGMAMLPMTTFLAAALIGGFLTAQEFEFHTILEYRLSPISPAVVFIARNVRLVLMGWLSAGILLIVIGLLNGVWPTSILAVPLILIPIALVGGGIGISAGLLLRSSLPAFVIGLGSTFACWILGAAFGLPAGFSGAYEFVSRFVPNTYAVELLFPLYYDTTIGDSIRSILALTMFSALALGLAAIAYHRRVVSRQE
jgi:hypothetical protein